MPQLFAIFGDLAPSFNPSPGRTCDHGSWPRGSSRTTLCSLLLHREGGKRRKAGWSEQWLKQTSAACSEVGQQARLRSVKECKWPQSKQHLKDQAERVCYSALGWANNIIYEIHVAEIVSVGYYNASFPTKYVGYCNTCFSEYEGQVVVGEKLDYNMT